MTDATRQQIYDTVDVVLREDLKLGDAEFQRDTPLFDGNLGLDSLDALMLVSGVEKRLGMKLPNKKLGRDSMETIDHFVTFVSSEMDENASDG